MMKNFVLMNNQNFIRLFFPVIFVFGTSVVNAQSRVTFEYDLSGNRISKTVFSVRSGSMAMSSDQMQTNESNPVSFSYTDENALLTVSVKKVQNETKVLQVYTKDGFLVLTQAITSSSINVSLLSLKSGVYVASVTVEGKPYQLTLRKK